MKTLHDINIEVKAKAINAFIRDNLFFLKENSECNFCDNKSEYVSEHYDCAATELDSINYPNFEETWYCEHECILGWEHYYQRTYDEDSEDWLTDEYGDRLLHCAPCENGRCPTI